MSTKVIVIANHKGGVGKTTAAAAIGDVMARKLKKKVLLIDADPQGNLSKRYGYDISKGVPNSLDVYLENELGVVRGTTGYEHMPVSYFCNPGKKYSQRRDIRSDYDNLDIICASSELEGAYSAFRTDPSSAEGIIRNMLSEIRETGDYDYVLVDTQPALSYALQQFLLGAEYIMIPVTPNTDAFDGANAIGVTYNKIKRRKEEYARDNTIEFLGAFVNMLKRSTKVAKEFKENMDKYWQENPMFNTQVPMNQDANNAELKNAPVTIAYPSSSAAVAFASLTREVVNKIEH